MARSFTTKEAFRFLNLMQVKLPQTLVVFRNNLHQFFQMADEMSWEEVEAKKEFVPLNFTDKLNYTGFAITLDVKE